MSKKDLIIPFPELHSEEVHEIISHPPHWLVRWGITVLFGIMIMLIGACWVVRYPDILSVAFTLTASSPPRAIIIRSDGKLEKLLVKDGSMVRTGDLLAFCESTANASQVLELEHKLIIWNKIVSNGQWENVSKLSLSQFTDLGEMQNDFQTFALKLSELRSVLSDGLYHQRRLLLLKDMDDLRQLERNLAEQMELQMRDYQLAQEEFTTQESLYKQKVIAPVEYKREKAKLLLKEFPLKALSASLIQNRSSQTGKQKEVLELDGAISEQKNNFLQTLQTLQSSVLAWKQRYVLIAPIAGKISFSAPWTERQHLTNGEELLVIEPNVGELVGIVKIPHANLGKVEVGQKILIKLDGYPFREFGMVSGQLSKLSQTPGRDSLYWGYVTLPNQLTTLYRHKLHYKHGMKGTAEIITKDKRLAERLLSTFRDGGR